MFCMYPGIQKREEEIGAGLSSLGAVLMAICVGIFSSTNLIRDKSAIQVNPTYGYSFYMALASLLFSAGSEGISITKILSTR